MMLGILGTLRILIVEDYNLQREAVERYLRQIVEGPGDAHEMFKALNLKNFEIDTAACSNEARRLLEQAVAEDRPYDLLLLDLSLPVEVGDKPESAEKGLDIITDAKTKGAARKVIVVSHYYELTEKAFNAGAFDFIAKKPYEREELQKQVLIQIHNLLSERCSRLLNERLMRLAPFADMALAHNFGALFSGLTNTVARTTESIQQYAHKRYGLDQTRDAQDALMRQLQMQQEAMQKARREWARLQSRMMLSEQRQRVQPLTGLLRQLQANLAVCLTVKKTELQLNLPDAALPVQTFEHVGGSDVETVLQEIVAGGVTELPDYGGKRKITVTSAANSTVAAVRFDDDLEPLAQEDADEINQGYNLVPDPEFRRKWGLSVVQHIALLGGGELLVEPKPGGNVITYRIPLAKHA